MATLPSVAGCYLLEWYNKGVTDLEDLRWCLQFYRGIDFHSTNLVGFALTEARRYREERIRREEQDGERGDSV